MKYKTIHRVKMEIPKDLILSLSPTYKGSGIYSLNITGVNNSLLLSDLDKDIIDEHLREILKIIKR